MFGELFHMEKLFGFCEKVCYLFLVNLLFLVFNVPVMLFFLFVGISQAGTYLPLFLLCLLPLPPAFCAVVYAMNRLVRGTESGPWKDYRKGYRTDFWQKLRLGAIQLLIFFILWSDIKFFSGQLNNIALTLIFFILFLFVVLITPNLYLLISRYQMTNRQVVKSACILTVTRPVCTMGQLAALGIILMLFELTAGTTVLFMASIYGLLIVYVSYNMLNQLEENMEH